MPIVTLLLAPDSLPVRAIVILGYVAAGALYLVLRKRMGGSPQPLTLRQRAGLGLGVLVGSVAGAAMVGWAESLPIWQAVGEPALRGHLGLGAMLGGWIGLEIAKRLNATTQPSGNAVVFPILVAMTFARLAAVLDPSTGLRAGLPTSLPWGLDFGDAIARHPTQFYELAFGLVLAAIFLVRLLTRRQRGCMFSQFVFAYFAFSFIIEFARPRVVVTELHLSIFQFAAIVGMGHALLHWRDECCALPSAPPIAEPANGVEFVEMTTSLCPSCLEKIEAKMLIENGRVIMQKYCPVHGLQRVLISDDAAYWRESRRLYKPPTAPQRRNTAMKHGCPHDCGICPDHEQHSCLAIVEITQQCDLACPVCYASSTPSQPHRTLEQIRFMLDSAVANEGRVNVVQISGGEPSLHPELFAVFDEVKKRPIRHLMLNTNGRRIAEDPDFVRRLADYMPGFEVYLQFDSLRPATLVELRGRDLSGTRRRAVDALAKHDISTTLVATLKRGVNDDQVGEILAFAQAHPNVRGVTFQPVQAAGRLHSFDPERNRLTLSEVRKSILAQNDLFTAKDLVPVPCHTDALAMGYALRLGKRMIPLSKMIDPRSLLSAGGNTICYEQDAAAREHIMRLFSASASPASAAESLEAVCCATDLPRGITYRNIFRVIIMQFMDAWSMDLRSLKRSCVHIVHPDGRLIPFETYNLFYRDSLKQGETVLAASGAQATAP